MLSLLQVKNQVANQLQSSLNDINWDIVGTTSEEKLPLNQIAPNINKQSIKIVDGVQGPEVYFTAKDNKGVSRSYSIISKDVGGKIQESTRDLYRSLAGGDADIEEALLESHIYSSLKPISKDSNYDMKDDIINKLPKEIAENLKNYKDLKITYSGKDGGLRLTGKKIDPKGLTSDSIDINEDEGNVANLIDQLIIYAQ